MQVLVLILGAIGVGMIAFALRPGPWVFGITEQSLRIPPGLGPREWWSDAEIQGDRDWIDEASDLVDWAVGAVQAIDRHAKRPAMPVGAAPPPASAL